MTTLQVNPKTINIISAGEFGKMAIPKTQWSIHNLFEKGTINMLSAAPNHYKSWLVIDIAFSLAVGSPLFGYYPINHQQKVWIINEEDTHSGIKERLDILNKAWPEMPLYFSIQNQIMLNDLTIHQIIYSAKERNIDFIVFDSLRSIHEADENSSTEMQKIMNLIKKITYSGITVLFTHHNRKKSMYKSSEGEDSRGSTAINAAVHSHLSCEPKNIDGQEYLILKQAKLKSAKKLEPFRLSINLGDPTGSFVWDGKNTGNISHEKLVQKIIQILENSRGSGINTKSFVSANISGEKTIRKVLTEMEVAKSIVVKTWSEIQTEKLDIGLQGSASNEKFYFLPTAIKEA